MPHRGVPAAQLLPAQYQDVLKVIENIRDAWVERMNKGVRKYAEKGGIVTREKR